MALNNPVQTSGAVFPQKALRLQASQVRQALQEMVDYSVQFDDLQAAYQTYRYLEWNLSQVPRLALDDPAAAAQYQQWRLLLQAVILPLLSETEIESFFKEHATVGLLHPEIDLWEKLVGKLVRIFVFEERDPFKARLRGALESNTELLTQALITQGDKTVSGTVGNWLQDYRRAAGGARVSSLARSAYLTNSINTKALIPGDREKLKKLMDFYERLKLSSMEYAGMEEVYLFEAEGKLWALREGRLEEAIDPQTKAAGAQLEKKGLYEYPNLVPELAFGESARVQQGLKELIKSVYGASDPKVVEAQRRLQGVAVAELAKRCYDFALPGPGKRVEVYGALASLELLAQRGELAAIFRYDPRFKTLVEQWLTRQGRTTELENFRLQPELPVYMGQLWQIILKEQLRLSESEAAKYAVRLGNLLQGAGKTGYQDLAYFDAEKKVFIWK